MSFYSRFEDALVVGGGKDVSQKGVPEINSAYREQGLNPCFVNRRVFVMSTVYRV